MVWLKLSTSLLSFISKINLPVPRMWLANPHSILRGGFSLSRAKAVFIPPAELVVVARSSYPKEQAASCPVTRREAACFVPNGLTKLSGPDTAQSTAVAMSLYHAIPQMNCRTSSVRRSAARHTPPGQPAKAKVSQLHTHRSLTPQCCRTRKSSRPQPLPALPCVPLLGPV